MLYMTVSMLKYYQGEKKKKYMLKSWYVEL